MVAAPVEVHDLVWAEPTYQDGVGWVVNQVDVQFEFTSAFNGIMHFRVTATGTAPGLPDGTDEFRTLNVSAGTVLTLQTFFNPALPVSEVDDIHVMVCESSAAQPFGRCAP